VPITIATDVGEQTVAEIEQRSEELSGMAIEESSVRIYPKNDFAAHVIGYLGQTQDEDRLAELEEMGYSSSDLVGISGVEYTMEYELSANTSERKGSVTNEVDTKGNIIRELERVEAQNGNSVVLTIDTELQKLTEEALAQKYCGYSAEQGATRRKNLKNYLRRWMIWTILSWRLTARRLLWMWIQGGACLANHSSYDLNRLPAGISDEEYTALKDDESLPLFNKAISSKAMPGSISSGDRAGRACEGGVVTTTETITDLGAYTKLPRTRTRRRLLDMEQSRTTHGDEDIVSAIKDSCNYYFFYGSG
jgi:penicillin-binding protein 2